MNHRTYLVGVVLGLATAVTTPAIASPVGHKTGPNLVANGGFETGDFGGWTATVDTGFTGVDDVAAHSGAFGAYFGDAGTPGSIAQSLTTQAGASYDIRFWLRSDGSTPNSVQVLWRGTSVYSATNIGAFGYTEILIDPQALSGLTTFELRLRDDSGFLEIDDISVRQVPEPAGIALFAPALLGLVAVRRRKSSGVA